MNRGRQAGLLMLVAMLWTLAPALSCWRTSAGTLPACCQNMPPDCPMSSMNTDASCCRMHGQTAAEIPEAAAPAERGLSVALVPPLAVPPVPWTSRTFGTYLLEPSPSDTSPGRSSVLRV